MKVKIVQRPSGAVSIDGVLQAWPKVGEVIDLPGHVAEGMIGAGTVVRVAAPSVETRPAPSESVETRPSPTRRTSTRKAKD